MEVLRYNDPDYSVENYELANCRSMRNLMRDSQQLIRNLWTILPKISFRLPKGSGLIPANEYCKGYTLESSISTLLMKLVRHLDRHERETDGAVHWKSMGPKLQHAFQKGGHASSHSDSVNHTWKGSNKTRLQYHKNSNDVLLYIRTIQWTFLKRVDCA